MFKIKMTSIRHGITYLEASTVRLVSRGCVSEFAEYSKNLISQGMQNIDECVAILSFGTGKRDTCLQPIWRYMDLYVDGEHLCSSTVCKDAADNPTIQPKQFSDEKYGAYTVE